MDGAGRGWTALILAALLGFWVWAEWQCVAAMHAPMREMPDGSFRDNDGAVRYLAYVIGVLAPLTLATAAALLAAWLIPVRRGGRVMRDP